MPNHIHGILILNQIQGSVNKENGMVELVNSEGGAMNSDDDEEDAIHRVFLCIYRILYIHRVLLANESLSGFSLQLGY